MAQYDVQKLKEQITTEQILMIVSDFGGNPTEISGGFISDTICHNQPGEGSKKLYYYENSKLFRCYTECNDAFDIFELTIKCFRIQKGLEINLPEAINYVCRACGIKVDNIERGEEQALEDWKILNKYDRLEIKTPQSEIVLGEYNANILQHLPHPKIAPWLAEGMSQEALDANNICYEPGANKIVIPHYDINGRLVGIRGRALSVEDEANGKYRPIILNGIDYKHPLGFNLYGIDKAAAAIKSLKKAIIFEGEKSVLLYHTYFGTESPIAVAVCGSNLTAYQVNLLLSLGVEEICIAFDKQFKELGDQEWKKWTDKLKEIHQKYSAYAEISFLFDTQDLIGYKDSPIDCGKEKFLELFERRISL